MPELVMPTDEDKSYKRVCSVFVSRCHLIANIRECHDPICAIFSYHKSTLQAWNREEAYGC